MSADNMILVDNFGEKFRVSMQFASDDEYWFKDSDPTFDTLKEAIDAAIDMEVHEVVVEYGIVVDPSCFDYYDRIEFDPGEGDVCSDHPTNGRSLADGCNDCDPDHFDEEGNPKLEFLMDCGA